MGIHDRPYWKDQPSQFSPGGGAGGPMGGMRLSFPKPARAIRTLLIINIIVFVAQQFADLPTPEHRAGMMTTWLGVTVDGAWQIWRYITFQFLHAGFWHIVMNMLGLYILGSPLEKSWGSRRFVTFYLTCGVVAGLAYVVIAAMFNEPSWMPIIGASGGVYGVILACAVFFPRFIIIFLFFPVPIRLAALIIFGGMIIIILRALGEHDFGAAMSDVAHLGGAVAAAVWIWVIPRLKGAGGVAGVARTGRAKINQGAWRRKQRRREEEAAQIDQILQKIKDHGIASLTRGEKKALQEATSRQRDQDPRIDRM